MPKRRSKAKALIQGNTPEMDDILDVGLRPIQRFLQGNGWKRLKEHPRYSGIEECWEKKLQDGRVAWMFQYPDSEGWNRGKNPYGIQEPTWRMEIYRANPRYHEETTLAETPMLYLLRAIFQRLSTWNRRRGGEIPGGSGPHTFF